MSKKAADQLREQVLLAFPDAQFGVTNCRKISGSSSWSQHSWSGANDITHKDHGYSSNPTHQVWLRELVDWLRDKMELLSLKSILGPDYNSAHADHVHADHWPKGYSTPPCAGGSHRTQYSSGRVVSGDPGPENGYVGAPPEPPQGGNDFMLTITRSNVQNGDRGDMAATAQSLLARHSFPPSNTFTNNVPDGIFGNASDSATRAFQGSAGLGVDGVIGPNTWAALEAS